MNFQNFGKNLSADKEYLLCSDFGAQITPFASRTFQFTKEQLGQADDKTQLPPDYIDLEKKVDALKQAHQKMLSVTTQYSNEPYDYPPNIRESFQDLGRTVSEKVTLLSSATSPAEAQAALVAPPSAKPQPKTFNHAIARASLASSQLLHQNHTGAGEDSLATALEKYALAMERVGEARLGQDAQIQSRFLAGWNTTLNTNLAFASRARKNVEKSRLNLDAVKARVKGNTFKLGGQGGQLPHEEPELSPEAQEEIEKAEDEFVTQTEEAVSVMKNVLDTPEPLRNLAELIAAQMEYHKKAYDILSELAPVVEGLQTEQEVMQEELPIVKALCTWCMQQQYVAASTFDSTSIIPQPHFLSTPNPLDLASMRPTLRVLARYLEAGTPTGLTGLWTHATPRSTLLYLYGSTLNKLQSVPETSVYRQSVEALTKHRMALVEELVPPGYKEWASKARELVNKNPEQFRVNSGRVDGSEARTVKLGDRVFVVGVRHEDGDIRSEEWDGEGNEGPELEGIRTPEERKDQVVWAERKPLTDHEKVEWEDEPQLTADQYVAATSARVWAITADAYHRIHELEQKIGAGLIEEVIQVAEGEHELVDRMIQAKVWEDLEEKPVEGQWTYFERSAM
ncbi:hypothetical protein S7711_00704 [Stachybotrys chartarum IBT 7711]|uniref:BAR domain-containing protein n=1 Tax=Stachybotrys chartarum (strain CBS 109288 / IBT 7711) TaxID=1280523 RepID=A0A084AZY0_STACB|nr:hypothetical protein S7711_00704 [Stachybotrys chartarum IBT 7711]KFA49570.1 hypothetical protein S40293_02880 [Stachybotrys chartarum IBT 40293]KFA73645.1 hypothetical protein S40288_02602 [Stachybotrys chartarum IBT 40288]